MTLRVHDLGKRLAGKRVLERFSLHVDDGEVVAVTGENGAGKSTLLRIIAGVLEADEGQVAVRGHFLSAARAQALCEVGFVPEGADPPPQLTVSELLALVQALRRAPAPAPAVLAALGIDAIRHERVGSLSLGQRRRACLAAALVGKPWLLVLDEPENGLDLDGVRALTGLLREHTATGRAVLLATHDLAFADGVSARRIVLSTIAQG